MKLSDLPGMKGKWIKKEELDQPLRVKIVSVKVEEVGEEKEPKAVVMFDNDRGWIPNKTCLITAGAFLGDDTDTWAGKVIELYRDENVRYAGKKVGGIAVREAK